MAQRTLATCWKQYQKLSLNYLAEGADRDAIQPKLDDLSDRVNKDTIGAVLVSLFIHPFFTDPVKMDFDTHCREGVSDQRSAFDPENNVITILPVSVFQLYEFGRNLEAPDPARTEMVTCRYHRFLIEMTKMSPVPFLFLLVLQRVAFMAEIAHLEKRGGVIEVAEGESYHTMLWAFKELEVWTRRQRGVNLRAQYGICWYEADWITGR